MKVERVEHVAIATRDLEESKRALERVFGLTLESETEVAVYGVRMAMYRAGETSLELMQGPADTPIVGKWLGSGEGLFHLCLEVDDVRAALADLRARGIRLLTAEPVVGHGGALVAFVDPADTAGVLFEIAEPAPPDSKSRAASK